LATYQLVARQWGIRMGLIFGVLVLIAIVLFMILDKISDIGKRMREHFPTEKEQDYDWALGDPLGHYEAHKDDKNKSRPGGNGSRFSRCVVDDYDGYGMAATD
jgi:hypothetical protein